MSKAVDYLYLESKTQRGRVEGEGQQFLHPLVDVDDAVAVGAAVLHVLAGVDAERDATAQEEPAGVQMQEISEIAGSFGL